MPVNIKGKEYRTVPERLLELHRKNKCSIETEIISNEGDICIIKTTITIFDEDREYKYTGHAFEKAGSTFINKTSHIENAETSSIGRALASAGLIGDSFASAEEVANAVSQQNKFTNKKTINTDLSKLPVKPKMKEINSNGGMYDWNNIEWGMYDWKNDK